MRIFEIISVILEYSVFYKFNKHSNKILGRRIREACERLGTTYIKFGQMLSTRYDILSEKDCKELQKLFDQIKEVQYSKIREIFKHDFEKYPEEIFEGFNSKPISSASIAQVYKAKLKSGEFVAVKIRRPYIGRKIINDMDLLINIVRFLQVFSPSLKTVNAKGIVKEMKFWLLQEIDFESEVQNMLEIKKYYKFCDGIKYRDDLPPAVFIFPYPKLCSKNVITMNYIDGIPLSKINLIRDNPKYNIYLSLKSYVNAGTHALFHNKGEYLFQADPHPANILILKDGRASSVDLGLIGRISPENVKKTKKLFLAVYSEDIDNTVRSALELCGVSYKKYSKKIRKDIKEYLKKAPYKGVGFWFMEIVRIFIKHRKMPTNLNTMCWTCFLIRQEKDCMLATRLDT